MSRLKLRNAPPADLASVDIYRQILPRAYISDGNQFQHADGYFSGTISVSGTFTGLPDPSNTTSGRTLVARFDTSSGGQAEIVVTGDTEIGATSETVYCLVSGVVTIPRYWKTLSSIVITGSGGSTTYGIGSIEISEQSPIRVAENGGDSYVVQSYANGELELVSADTLAEYTPARGAWLVDYPIQINIPVGNKGYAWLGSDGGTAGWDGQIESPFFSLASYGDVRTGETSSSRNFTALHLDAEAPQPDSDTSMHIGTDGSIVQLQGSYVGWTYDGRPQPSVNADFGHSVAIDSQTLVFDDARQYISSRKGTIEFVWSPSLDTRFGTDEQHYIMDVSNTRSESTTSLSSTSARLSQRVSSVYRVYLAGDLERTPLRHKLLADGRTLVMREKLPAPRTPLVVQYTPIDYRGDRMSLAVDGYNTLTYRIDSGDKYIAISRTVDFARNTWHRAVLQWSVDPSGLAAIRMFIDGDEDNSIVWGSPDMVWGEFSWGQNITSTANNTVSGMLNSGGLDEFSLLSFGGAVDGTHTYPMRIDNVRISSAPREMSRIGQRFYDLNWNSQTSRMVPVVSDAITTALFDFDRDTTQNTQNALAMYATSPLYTVQVDIDDGFSRVLDSEKSSELLKKLYGRLKPAHIRLQSRYKQENT